MMPWIRSAPKMRIKSSSTKDRSAMIRDRLAVRPGRAAGYRCAGSHAVPCRGCASPPAPTTCSLLLGADTVVIRQNFIEALAVFVRRLVQLLADCPRPCADTLGVWFRSLLRLLHRLLRRARESLHNAPRLLRKRDARSSIFASPSPHVRLSPAHRERAHARTPDRSIVVRRSRRLSSSASIESVALAALLLPAIQSRAKIVFRLDQNLRSLGDCAVLRCQHRRFKRLFGSR